MGVKIPHGKGQFWWIGVPIVKHRHFLPWAVQERLNRSICRLGCRLLAVGRKMHKFNRFRQVASICPHWTMRLRRWSALCQIILSTCYLWTRPLIQSHRWSSASSRILYCGQSTQYSRLVSLLNASCFNVKCKCIFFCQTKNSFCVKEKWITTRHTVHSYSLIYVFLWSPYAVNATLRNSHLALTYFWIL